MESRQNLISFFKKEFPLVKMVEYDEHSMLCYDGRAHMFFIINNDDLPIVAAYLQNHCKEDLLRDYPHETDVDSIIHRIETLQSKGVMLPGPLDQLISTNPEDVKQRIEYNMNNILMRKFVLETTQQCNFRCRYCHNTLEPIFRHHTKSQMTLHVAKSAIDFYKDMYLKFYRRLPAEKKELLLRHYPPFIGFYGGEPSLNWQLVENAADYYLNLNWNVDGISPDLLTFAVNTNLYILTDEMLSFIRSHRPMLFVSLDGPKEDNDRNRVTIDGHGTFDRVYANLLRIKQEMPNYFKEKILLLCVEAEGNNTEAVHALLDSMGCPIDYLKEQPYGCVEREPENEIQFYDENEQELISDVIQRYCLRMKKKDPNALDEFISLYFLEGIESNTPVKRRHKSVSLTCPLCVDNIMIGTKGEMHLCHKTDGSLPLGNVCEGGYDMQKMLDAYVSYGEATNCWECRNCWAMNMCSYCAAIRLYGGKWNNPKPSECDLQRRRIEYSLKLFVAAYKLDPTIIPRLMERKKDLNVYKSIVDYNDFIRL